MKRGTCCALRERPAGHQNHKSRPETQNNESVSAAQESGAVLLQGVGVGEGMGVGVGASQVKARTSLGLPASS